MLNETNADVYKVKTGPLTYYVDDDNVNIWAMLKNSTDNWSIQRISARPSAIERHCMKQMENIMDGKFDSYATGGGIDFSEFVYLKDGYYNAYTITNDVPTNMIFWRIPVDEDYYECLGQEEYIVEEWDMTKDECCQIEKKIYEYLVMNMSDE